METGEEGVMADLLKMALESMSPEQIDEYLESLSQNGGISVRTYRAALKMFKAIHINTPPSYRKKVLEEEKGEIRFRRGPGK